MALPGQYLITTKNLGEFLNAIKTAKAPDRVGGPFLRALEFSSSNDRLLIGLLKSLGMTDESGVPTARYFEFLDQSRSGYVLAEGLREAYADLFAINTKAHLLSVEDLKNKIKTLTHGQYSDNVVGLMAKTFKAVADIADWSAPANPEPDITEEAHEESAPDAIKKVPVPTVRDSARNDSKIELKELHYNIQIVMPETRDAAVFDAIFESLKKHLL